MKFIKVLQCSVISCVLCLIRSCVTSKPHIIIIVGDDIGWNDFGFHGSNQIPTPNIDALGYNGVILDRYYTQQTCTPSRAALLTGNYPIRSGLQGTPLRAGENRHIPLNMPTLSERLKELGYKTHLVGKWHLGAAHIKNTPTKRGFDTHFGYWNGFVGYFDYIVPQEVSQISSVFSGFDLYDQLTPQWQHQGEYATKLFTKKAVDIIQNHDNEEPLFLMLSHLAGHSGKNGTELEVPNITETNEKYAYITDPRRRRYADIVNIMDQSVGKVVKTLSERNMLENSVILFFSDNGAQTSGFIYANSGSGWPLRGQKFTLYEGGVRGSAVLYSSLLQHKGYINKNLIHISDWMPTLYAAAGGNVDDLGQIDGINQWPTITMNITTRRSEILLNIDESYGNSAVISDSGRYKLVNGSFMKGQLDQYYGENGRGPQVPPYNIDEILNSDVNTAIKNSKINKTTIETLRRELDISSCRAENYTPHIVCEGLCLFDLFSDPCETHDIFNENPKTGEIMKKRLTEFFYEMVPQKNRAVDLDSNPIYYNNTWCTWLDKGTCYRSENK